MTNTVYQEKAREIVAEFDRRAINTEDGSLVDDIATALQEAAEGAWMPIETAPKDGTPIIVWGGPDISNPTGGYYPRSCWWSQCDHGVWVVRESAGEATYIAPSCLTHWMPLPTPPKADQ
jgi:hypothetical protein